MIKFGLKENLKTGGFLNKQNGTINKQIKDIKESF